MATHEVSEPDRLLGRDVEWRVVRALRDGKGELLDVIAGGERPVPSQRGEKAAQQTLPNSGT